MESVIRVVVADDERLLRSGLRALLLPAEDIAVVGEAEDGHQALQAVRQLVPDVILLDLCMRNLDGFEVLSRIRKAPARTRVLVVSSYDEAGYVARALALGCDGYLLKSASSQDLIDAIRDVARGAHVLDPGVPAYTVRALAAGLTSPGGRPVLTHRQHDILQLIVDGRSSKETAFALGLSVKTVDAHRARIMQRLGVRELASLVRIALDQGLVARRRTSCEQSSLR